MLCNNFIIFSNLLACGLCYSNSLYANKKLFGPYVGAPPSDLSMQCAKLEHRAKLSLTVEPTDSISEEGPQIDIDPVVNYNNVMRYLLFGDKSSELLLYLYQRDSYVPIDFVLLSNMQCHVTGRESQDQNDSQTPLLSSEDAINDPLALYPSGNVLRAELFQNKTSVHLLPPELVHKGHCYLRQTEDYMQTALNAFSIFLEGNLQDVLRLPSDYVLRSARTIAMMKIAKEKLAATWTVVKGGKSADQVTFETLQMYRPLFKYLNGREMARLNLNDTRILTFIGTHPDLDRHQVGVVASKYIKTNPDWLQPQYLNQMNNLLCGVPMTFIRRIKENIFMQLTHQVFYHIKACDPLQRRFYFAMMTKTQALGKSYSWSARDVSRLGLLLSEVEGPELAAVNPEAMSGITAQVMLEIPPSSLKHITEMQLRYIGQKPLNILAKKLRIYQDQLRIFNHAISWTSCSFTMVIGTACVVQVIK